MANQYQIADLQGGAAKAERIIFPTAAARVTVTNAADVPQAGVEPGDPEPEAGNIGAAAGVTLGVVGRLRQDAATDPTVEVLVEDLVAALPRGESDVTDILAGLNGNRTRIKVPRFSIKRTNYDQGDDSGFVLVRPAWTVFQEIDAAPPGKGASTVDFGPAEIVDRDGNLLIAFAAEETSTGDGFVVIYRYQPHKETTASHLLTIDVDAASGRSGVPVYDLELVEYGGDVYVLLGVEGADSKPALQVYQLTGTNGDSPAAIYLTETFATPAGGAPVTVAATSTPGGVLVAVQDSSLGLTPVRMGLTQDLRTFDEVSGDGGIVTFSEFRQAYGNTLNGRVYDIVGASATELWAVTGASSASRGGGEILRSVDGGGSWTQMASPCAPWNNPAGVSIPLHSIARYADTLLAVGGDGIVLKSTDAGVTWAVVRYPAGDALRVFNTADVTALEVKKTDLPNVPWFKVRMVSASRAWIVGAAGSIYYTADGGTTWNEVRKLDSPGAYLDFVVDGGASGNVMLVVGDADVHRSEHIADADQAKVACLISDADDHTGAGFTQLLDQDEIAGGAAAVTLERNGNSPKANANTQIGYILGRDGEVFRTLGNGTTISLTKIAALQPAGGLFLDIDSPDQATGGTTGDVVVTCLTQEDGPGLVFQATSAHTGTDVAFTGQHARQSPTAAWMLDVNHGAIGTTRTLWQSFEAQNIRLFPDLHTSPDGSVLYACNNASKSWVEIYHAPRPAPGTRPNFRLVKVIKTSAAGLAPRFAGCADGSVICAVGAFHWIGVGGGAREGDWMRADTDPRLPLPILHHAEPTGYSDTPGIGENGSIKQRRALVEFNGGELFGAVPALDKSKIGVFRCWDWSKFGTLGRPILQGLPRSLGVDGLRVVASGDPQPRDKWTIRPRHLYRVEHLATDSPSAETWRSKTDDDAAVLELDAQSDVVADQIGARTLWRGTFFGLFGSNVWRAIFRISDPAADGVFTYADQQVNLGGGICTGPASVTASNILKVAGASWTPGQWAPGARRFFATFLTQGLSYRILGNGEDWLEVEGEVDLTGGTAARTVAIYSDRVCWDGRGGAGPGSAGLLGSDYRFGRIVQCEIPAQATPDGFFEAGRLFVGEEVEEDDEAFGFVYGMRLRLVANTEQEFSKGGIASVRHYGRTGRVWSIEYPHQSPDAVQRRIGGILERMREPFVIVWNRSDLQTATLVQLVDAPEIANSIGNRYALPFAVQEVQ